jgi:hypothetical protein
LGTDKIRQCANCKIGKEWGLKKQENCKECFMGYESLRNGYGQRVLKENQMDIMNWDPGGTKKENHKNLVIGWIGQSGEILNVDKKNWEEELRNYWGKWLTEDWYREVILFRLFREVEGDMWKY